MSEPDPRPDPRIAALRCALDTVIDPELGLGIATLDLAYGIEMDGDIGVVTYTLTTPGCPMERYITAGIHEAARGVEGLTKTFRSRHVRTTDGDFGLAARLGSIGWMAAWTCPGERHSALAASGSPSQIEVAPRTLPNQ